jgi:hypothetical protein
LTVLVSHFDSIFELTPVVTLAISSDPRNARHRHSAPFTRLNTIEKMLVRDTRPRVVAVRKRLWRRSTRPDWWSVNTPSALPESRRSEQGGLVFGQARLWPSTRRPSGTWLVGPHKRREGCARLFTRQRQSRSDACRSWPWPAGTWAVCSARWPAFGPPAFCAGRAKHLRQRFPETQRSVTKDELRIELQTALAQAQQQLFPRRLGFAKAIG